MTQNDWELLLETIYADIEDKSWDVKEAVDWLSDQGYIIIKEAQDEKKTEEHNPPK